MRLEANCVTGWLIGPARNTHRQFASPKAQDSSGCIQVFTTMARVCKVYNPSVAVVATLSAKDKTLVHVEVMTEMQDAMPKFNWSMLR